MIRIRPSNEDDQAWVRRFTIEHWGGESIVAHGVIYLPHRLSGFVACDPDGVVAGLATYQLGRDACEVVTINAIRRGMGIGTSLLRAVERVAREAGCGRLWLTTTNDNLDALAFYQKRGMRIVGVHRDALVRSRRLKPSIPLVGANGIALQDELELELRLQSIG